MKVDGYVRVSQVAGRGGPSFISPTVQREAIERWAAFRHAELLDVHVDLDEGGGRMDRPGLELALERVEAGISEGIVVAKLDRFSRNLTGALEAIRRLDAVGAAFVSVAEGLDPSTPAGKMMMRLLLVMAEFELDRMRDNWNDSRRRAVGRGLHISGSLPLGYVRLGHGPLVVDPGPAERVATCFRMRAERRPWTEIVAFGRESSEGGVKDALWSRDSVRKLMKNRVYIGEAHSGPYGLPGAHEPIVERGIFEAAQLTRAPKAQFSRRSALLAGLLRCSGCGISLSSTARSRVRGPDRPVYWCPGGNRWGPCPRPTRVAGPEVEALVEEEFLDLYSASPLARRASESARRLASARLEAAERELLESDRRRSRGREDGSERESLAEAVEAARRRLVDLTRSTLIASPAHLRRGWGSLAPSDHRRLIGLLLDAVLVRPDRGRGLADRLLFVPTGRGEGLPRPGIRSSLHAYEWSIPAGSRGVAVLHPGDPAPAFC